MDSVDSAPLPWRSRSHRFHWERISSFCIFSYPKSVVPVASAPLPWHSRIYRNCKISSFCHFWAATHRILFLKHFGTYQSLICTTLFQRVGWSLFRWSEIISDHFTKKCDNFFFQTRDRDRILDPIFRQGSRSKTFLKAGSRSDRRSYFLAEIEIGS